MNINNQTRKFIYISIGAIPAVVFRCNFDEVYLVNTIGCFLLGVFNSFSFSSKYKLILCIGFCGSLTTFSGWIFDLFELISGGFYLKSLRIVILMLIMGLIAVCFGNLLAKKINNLV